MFKKGNIERESGFDLDWTDDFAEIDVNQSCKFEGFKMNMIS